MPLQLRIFAVALGVFFLSYMVYVVRKNKAGVHQVVKWFVLGFVILIGAAFSDNFRGLTKLLGFRTYSNFAVFILLLVLLFFIFSLQLSVAKAEKQIIKLTQEVSLLKAKEGKEDVEREN